MSTTTKQGPVVAAVAVAIAGVAVLTACSRRRHGNSKRHSPLDEEFSNLSTTTNGSHERRMTLEETLQEDGGLVVKPIGTVRSIHRLCVGTPRQGLLAPSARGRLELNVDNGRSQDAVLELDGFSHVWVVFVFHLNTVSKHEGRRKVPSKIAPPALGGRKVGVLATRSPHRNNPIGMTLCKLESVTLPSKHSSKTVLNVSGLDLVDGTPILDIKPYVPHYDSVPIEQVRLPPWVSGGLATRRPVHIQSKALEELKAILDDDPNALDFYGIHRGDGSTQTAMTAVTQCIAEVLSIDVRSKWQTTKARDCKFQAERAGRLRDILVASSTNNDVSDFSCEEQCTQQLDNLLISYTVKAPEQHERITSEGSGAEDEVSVNSIQLLLSKRDVSSTLAVEDDGDDASASATNADEERTSTLANHGTVDTVPTVSKPPTDADYKSLKTYWSQAASQNTPTGLVPEETSNRRQSAEKYFVFSDKPVVSPTKITSQQQQSDDESPTTTLDTDSKSFET